MPIGGGEPAAQSPRITEKLGRLTATGGPPRWNEAGSDACGAFDWSTPTTRIQLVMVPLMAALRNPQPVVTRAERPGSRLPTAAAGSQVSESWLPWRTMSSIRTEPMLWTRKWSPVGIGAQVLDGQGRLRDNQGDGRGELDAIPILGDEPDFVGSQRQALVLPVDRQDLCSEGAGGLDRVTGENCRLPPYELIGDRQRARLPVTRREATVTGSAELQPQRAQPVAPESGLDQEGGVVGPEYGDGIVHQTIRVRAR